MRITLLFMFLLVFQLQAEQSYSQNTKISLDMRNSSVEKILQVIEEKSEFYFLYNSKLIDVDRKTDIRANEESIASVLNQLFEKENVEYEVKGTQIVLHPKEMNRVSSGSIAKVQQQQKRQVTGRIIDELGEPIIGANVVEKGTTNGTVTDIDGNFTLGVGDGAALQISYIGYLEQEIPTTGRSSVNITLREDTRALDEVVVVGYGTQRKGTLTGAVASINAEELLTTKSDNVINSMQGKVPGLLIRQGTGEPGQFDSAISIRGFGDPLYVIDGIVISRNAKQEFARLNPEDIESISILKDASAAIYGMNSGNGVIMVTTKKGRSDRTRVSYSGMYTLMMPTGMPDMLSSYEDRLLKNEYARNVGQQVTTSDEDLKSFKNGDPGYPDFDWIDAYLRKVTPSHNHTLSVRGGNDKVTHYTSLGYRESNGFIKNGILYDHQYTLRSNVSAQLSNDLTMNTRISGRMDKRRNGVESWIWTYKSLIVNDRGVEPYTMANNGHLSAVAPENKNPEALINPDLMGYNLAEKINGNATLDFDYKPHYIPGLNLNVLGSFDFAMDKEMRYRNTYKIYNYKTDIPQGVGSGSGENSYASQMWMYKRVYGKVQLNYRKHFGEHALEAMFAAEVSQRNDDMLMGKRLYADMYTFQELNQATASTATNEGTRGAQRYAAFIGRINYDYKGKYLLEAMARYDGSYKYSPRKMWTIFPSASVGWRVSEESFIKDNVAWINNLKLRTSYGSNGNDQGDYYEWLQAYNNNQNRGYTFDGAGWSNGMIPPGVVNDLMTWRKSNILNVGLDITFLRKFDIVLEWFERRNTGILASRVVTAPNTFGASFPRENINSDMNTGLELDAKYRGQAGEFKYTLGTNVSFSRYKVLYRERAPFTSQWDKWRNGEAYRYGGRLNIYTWDGQYSSLTDYETAPLVGGNRGNSRMLPGSYRIQDNNGDGRISGDDMLYASWNYGRGNDGLNPPLQFGFNVDLAYKSWDLAMTLQGASLYTVAYRHDDTMGYGTRYPTSHRRFLDRWHTTDPMADPLDPNSVWTAGKYPAGRPNFDGTSDGLMIDVWRPNATYLRLKNIELGYTLTEKELKKTGVQNIRIYVNATNMFTFAKEIFKEIDPEKREGEYENSLSYPLMKSVNFGINLSF